MHKKMRKLPKEKRMRGFDYRLLKRTDGVVLYSLSVRGSVYGYEVHKVRVKPEGYSKFKDSNGKMNIIKYPKREVLALTNEFGTFGWSYQFESDALKKFKEEQNGK